MKVKWLIGTSLSVLCACTPDVQPPIVDSVQPNDSVPSTDTPAPTYEELFDIERVSAVRLLMTTDACLAISTLIGSTMCMCRPRLFTNKMALPTPWTA